MSTITPAEVPKHIQYVLLPRTYHSAFLTLTPWLLSNLGSRTSSTFIFPMPLFIWYSVLLQNYLSSLFLAFHVVATFF